MDVDKTVSVVYLSTVRLICGTTHQRRKGNIHGAWYPERLVVVITTVSVLVEEDLADIAMKSRNVVDMMLQYKKNHIIVEVNDVDNE